MDDEKLILEVQKNEILYDKTNRMFKDITKKQDIWNEIGEKLQCSGKHVWLTFYKPLFEISGEAQARLVLTLAPTLVHVLCSRPVRTL